MIALTYEQVLALDPCPSGLAKASALLGWPSDRAVSVRDAIEAGVLLGDVLFVLDELKDPDVNRRLRLFAADCAARVLPIYERDHSDPAPRNAIITARRYARSEATYEELAAARDAAWDARPAEAAEAAWAAAGDARAAWAKEAAEAAGGDDETAWQRTRLIERMEGEPEDWPLEDVR